MFSNLLILIFVIINVDSSIHIHKKLQWNNIVLYTGTAHSHRNACSGRTAPHFINNKPQRSWWYG